MLCQQSWTCKSDFYIKFLLTFAINWSERVEKEKFPFLSVEIGCWENNSFQAPRVVQWRKALATKPDNLDFRTHRVDGENWLLQVVLWSSCAHVSLTQTNKHQPIKIIDSYFFSLHVFLTWTTYSLKIWLFYFQIDTTHNTVPDLSVIIFTMVLRSLSEDSVWIYNNNNTKNNTNNREHMQFPANWALVWEYEVLC